MSQVANIYLIGPVGKFEIEDGSVEGFDINDVIAQVQAYRGQEIDTFKFKMKGPGGYVEDGNEIYDYIKSLEKNHEIITEQVGPIGSIMTKLFLVPSDPKNRLVKADEEFMIHNPWGGIEGDSKEVIEYGQELDKIEAELRAFYKDVTGITEEGLKPLMNKETRMSAEQAIKLGFAGGYAESEKELTKALAKIKPKSEKMSKENKSVLDRIKAMLNKEEEEKVKAIDYTLESGATLRLDVESEEEAVGANAMVVDADGNESQAPEGSHTLDDGRIVMVNAAGIVDSIEMPQEEEEEGGEMAKMKEENEALKKENEALKASIDEKVQEAVKDAMKEVEEVSEEVEKELKALAKDREQLKAIRKIHSIPEDKDFVRELEEANKPTAYDKAQELKEKMGEKTSFKRGNIVEKKKSNQ